MEQPANINREPSACVVALLTRVVSGAPEFDLASADVDNSVDDLGNSDRLGRHNVIRRARTRRVIMPAIFELDRYCFLHGKSPLTCVCLVSWARRAEQVSAGKSSPGMRA